MWGYYLQEDFVTKAALQKNSCHQLHREDRVRHRFFGHEDWDYEWQQTEK